MPPIHALFVALLANSPFTVIGAFSVQTNTRIATNRHSSRAASLQSSSLLLKTLLRRFDGDFDNYAQVQEDLVTGLLPREGGGHEHIHCTLRRIPTQVVAPLRHPPRGISTNTIVALYYFNGNPGNLFRARCYTLHPAPIENMVEMRLWKVPSSATASARDAGSNRGSQEAASAVISELLSCGGLKEHDELKGCEVFWSMGAPSPDNALRRSLKEEGEVPRLIAHMEGGGCCVESERTPGCTIRVEDELFLWDNELWINDRGFNAETGEFVYGNQRGVPYEMVRVEESNSALSWTLGGKKGSPA